ncbi:MAG: DUF4399 domain-containing protein [Hyphomonadaceae bacterium]
MTIARWISFAAPCALAAALSACSPAPGSEGGEAETINRLNATVDNLSSELDGLKAFKTALDTPATDAGPAVYFVNLKDGDTVKSPVRVIFGLTGMGIAPAGIEKENTGHHHLLIDTQLSEEEMQYAIPNDAQHKHFGGGQTETVLDLPPGQHTLQLMLGDKNHELFDPPIMSDLITITVE